MNILLIHTHDTGRHLSPYGAPVETPHLQRLAEEGVLFRKAFCAAPQCSPSRASLMTGQWPHTHGLLGLAHRGFTLADPRRHLPNHLQAAGYHTALIGFQHEIAKERAAELGYQELLLQSGRHSVERALAAREWLRQQGSRPFFLSLGLTETHRPFDAHEPLDDPRFTAPLPWLPDTPEVRGDVAQLNTAVRHVDQAVGLVLGALREQRLEERTLVLFTTDHGVAFPKAKATLFDSGLGVALILRGPDFSGGRVVDGLVSQVDLFPTLCQSLRLPAPPGLQGKSLLPLARGEATQLHEAIFAEQTFHAAEDPMRCVRTERFKYIRCYLDSGRACLPNVDNSPAKTLQHQAGIFDRPRDREMLFDLLYDPWEFSNLAPDPAYAQVRKELAQRLERWMEETDDPLRHGPLPLPPGAKITPREAYDP